MPLTRQKRLPVPLTRRKRLPVPPARRAGPRDRRAARPSRDLLPCWGTIFCPFTARPGRPAPGLVAPRAAPMFPRET